MGGVGGNVSDGGLCNCEDKGIAKKGAKRDVSANEGEEMSYPFGGSCDLECFAPLLIDGWGLRGGGGLRHNRVGNVVHQVMLWGDVPKGVPVLADSGVGGCKVWLG